MKEYEGYQVQHDMLDEKLLFIVFKDYDEAYSVMLRLAFEDYMIHDLESVEKNHHVVWFSKWQ